MALPFLIVVLPVPIDHADLEIIGLVLIVFVLAAGIGWWLWRRK